MRAVVAVMSVALALSGCSGEDAEVGGRGAPAADESERPEPPRHVAAARVDSQMKVEHIRRCLYDEPVDISALAPNYYGPQDLIAGEVEKARDIDLTVPAISMVGGKEFARELRSVRVKLSRTEKKVNRWLEWNLGYRPFSKREFPEGDGAELVAAFYDPRAEEAVVSQKGELDAEYIFLAHELAHAAVDQRFGLPKRSSPRVIDDRALAINALVEGDATLVELRIQSLLGKKKAVKKVVKALLTSAARFKKNRANGVPHAAIDRFVFPYRWGVTFSCSVFRRRGWKGVNEVFSRLPVSTAEIMFPERYLKGHRPHRPTGFEDPPKGWKVFAKGTIGAAHLKTLFEAPADKEQRALRNPLGRAAAWDGGRYRLWARDVGEVNSIFGMSFVEHEDHEGVLCSSLIKWYEASFTSAEREILADEVVGYSDALRGGVIDCRGRRVQVAVGPKLRLAKSVLDL